MHDIILKELEDFIKTAGVDGKTYFTRPHYDVVVLDTETTGFSPSGDHVVQFSGLKGFLSEDGTIDLKKMAAIDFYIKSPVPMPEAASSVNGITDEILSREGIEPMSAADRINLFTENSRCAVIGHNIGFDIRMINGLFNQVCGRTESSSFRTLFSPEVVCDTLSLARKVVHGPKEEKPCALSNLIKRIGADDSRFKFHDSMNDVYATVEVYNWLVKNFTALTHKDLATA